MSKICVYTICKNELKFVEQWLENMSEADYIVVLDTGSTDGTYEKLLEDSRVTLVKQQEIKPWRFDVARNESMKLIPDDADILVCTDFDELFEPGWAQLLRDNWVPGYHNRCHYTYIWNHNTQGEPQTTFTYDKIHIRGLHWRFAVHEVLWPDNLDNYEENTLDLKEQIILHHWQDLSKSRKNYLELLKLACEEEPDCSHIWSLYGREYMLLDDCEKAIEILLKTLDCADIEYSDEQRTLLQTLYFLALNYYNLNNYDECYWYCQEFLRVNTSYREPYLLLSRAYIEQKLPILAEATINAMFNYTTHKKDWLENGDSWTWAPYAVLGATYINLKQWAKAQENLKIALQHEPDNVELLKQYILCLENQLNKIV